MSNLKYIVNKEIIESKKICIIGCGISGIYTALRLIQRYPNYRIDLYDKNDYIGGRCMTIKWHNRYINLGAGIFTPSHTHLLELLKELEIPINSFETTFHMGNKNNNGLYTDDTLFDIKLFNQQKEYVLNSLQTKYQKLNLPNLELQNMSVKQFIQKYFDNKIWKWIYHYSFFHDYLEMNLYEMLPQLLKGELFYNQEPYSAHSIKLGGWQVLIDKITLILQQNNNIQFYLNSLVKEILYDIDKKTFTIDIEHTKIEYDKVYVCGDFDVRKIDYKEIDVSFLNVIQSVPLLRIYGYSDKELFSKNSYFVPNDRKVIGINSHIQMICYKDSEKVIEHLHQYKSLISEQEKKLYDDTITKYWEHGVHIRLPFTQYDPLVKDTKGNNIEMYFLGEMMSDVLGFVEGAIRSVNYHFEIY